MIDTIRTILLALVVLMCVVRLTLMARSASEVEGWGFIFLAVGGAWKIAAIAQYEPWFGLTQDISDDLASLTLGLGLFMIVTHVVRPWEAISSRRPRRRRDDTASFRLVDRE